MCTNYEVWRIEVGDGGIYTHGDRLRLVIYHCADFGGDGGIQYANGIALSAHAKTGTVGYSYFLCTSF
jgi:hypothetical protein